MFSKKLIWILFIVLVAALAAWFIGRAGIEIYRYSQYSVKVEALVEKWTIHEKKGDQFAVEAHYSYQYEGKEYQGVGQAGTFYPNPWAAEEAKLRMAKQKWSVWIDPKHPERSLVEKHFPVKRTLSAVILISLVIYFLFLMTYTRIKNE